MGASIEGFIQGTRWRHTQKENRQVTRPGPTLCRGREERGRAAGRPADDGRLGAGLRHRKERRPSLSLGEGSTLSFFPEPKALGSADDRPAEGRPARGGAH